MLDEYQMLDEQKRFLGLLHPDHKIIFRSNHVSSVLRLPGTLPKDTDRLIQEVNRAIGHL